MAPIAARADARQPSAPARVQDRASGVRTIEDVTGMRGLDDGRDADAAFAKAIQFMGNEGRPVALKDGAVYGLNTSVVLPNVPGVGLVGNARGALILARRSGFASLRARR